MWLLINKHKPCLPHKEAKLVVFLSMPWNTSDSRNMLEKAGGNWAGAIEIFAYERDYEWLNCVFLKLN